MKSAKNAVLIILSVLLIITPLTSCTTSIHAKNNDNFTIVATLFPQYDFVKKLVGDRGEVILLLEPGTESHDYEPTVSDIIKINSSDLFIYTGDEMEVWAANLIKGIDNGPMILNVTEGITLLKSGHNLDEDEDEHGEDEHEHNEDEHDENEHDEDEHEHDEDEHIEDEHEGHVHNYDPHVWTSPILAKKMLNNILKSLIALDPEYAETYKNKASELTLQLDELDSELRELSKKENKKTLVFGGSFAFLYLTNEYGFKYISAYSGCSTEDEPSVNKIIELIETVKEQQSNVIYYEELSSGKIARTVAEETGIKLLLLHSTHNISKSEFQAGVSYVDIMHQNVINLREGL